MTQPDVPCRRKEGKDYFSHWHVRTLLLRRRNLITRMAQDKAVHCEKRFFFSNKSHYAGSMLPGETAGWNTTHIEMEECVKICYSLKASFWWCSRPRNTRHTCNYLDVIQLQSSSDVSHSMLEKHYSGLQLFLKCWIYPETFFHT